MLMFVHGRAIMEASEIKYATYSPVDRNRVNYAAGYDMGEAMRLQHSTDDVRRFVRDNSPARDKWTEGALHALEGLPSVYARG